MEMTVMRRILYNTGDHIIALLVRAEDFTHGIFGAEIALGRAAGNNDCIGIGEGSFRIPFNELNIKYIEER